MSLRAIGVYLSNFTVLREYWTFIEKQTNKQTIIWLYQRASYKNILCRKRKKKIIRKWKRTSWTKSKWYHPVQVKDSEWKLDQSPCSRKSGKSYLKPPKLVKCDSESKEKEAMTLIKTSLTDIDNLFTQQTDKIND